ncbi:hypothetical protein [Amycolatopsis magusensis]|uniref:hypothetical protein n=1 Tax=Amycolatopsis magusensis TaxID=882444 RepID=UPI003C2E92F3
MSAPWWKRYAKALLGAAATLTPGAVAGILALIGVNIDESTALAVCTVLGALLGGATVARVENAK